MNREQLDQFKANYANLIVDGMDMKTLEQFAVEMIEQNMSQWDEDDVKEEILDYYGEETLADLMPVLESQAPDYGVGK
jgi:flagellar motor component MotA